MKNTFLYITISIILILKSCCPFPFVDCFKVYEYKKGKYKDSIVNIINTDSLKIQMITIPYFPTGSRAKELGYVNTEIAFFIKENKYLDTLKLNIEKSMFEMSKDKDKVIGKLKGQESTVFFFKNNVYYEPTNLSSPRVSLQFNIGKHNINNFIKSHLLTVSLDNVSTKTNSFKIKPFLLIYEE